MTINLSVKLLLKHTCSQLPRGLYTTVHFLPANPYLKNPSAIKSLHQFSGVLDFKQKTYVCGLCGAKSKRKVIIRGNLFWSSIPNKRGHTKINECVKTALYYWILHNLHIL